MTKFMDWIFEGNRILAAFGIMHWIVGVVQRVFYEKPVEGLLLMIVGVLLVILSKMNSDA